MILHLGNNSYGVFETNVQIIPKCLLQFGAVDHHPELHFEHNFHQTRSLTLYQDLEKRYIPVFVGFCMSGM